MGLHLEAKFSNTIRFLGSNFKNPFFKLYSAEPGFQQNWSLVVLFAKFIRLQSVCSIYFTMVDILVELLT